jgi:hypothetical protein
MQDLILGSELSVILALLFIAPKVSPVKFQIVIYFGILTQLVLLAGDIENFYSPAIDN